MNDNIAERDGILRQEPVTACVATFIGIERDAGNGHNTSLITHCSQGSILNGQLLKVGGEVVKGEQAQLT